MSTDETMRDSRSADPADDDVEVACARLRDVLLATRHLGRRDFLRALASAAASSALLAPLAALASRPAAAQQQPVTYFTYGGAWKQAINGAFFEPFTKKTGIPVQFQEPYSFAKLRAMHEAKAQQIDVCGVNGMDVFIAGRIKMVTPIDWSVVDKSVLHPQQLQHENVIGCSSQSMNLCYSKKKWPGAERPSSWADFWNVEKFPGRRSLRRDALWTMEAAAKADGIKDDAFYPLDVDRVFRSLDRIKPHIKTWWSDNSQSQQLMEQDEVDLIYMTNGRATQSILDHKASFEMVWNEAIYAGPAEGWIVLAGCPNPKGGMKVLDFVGRPEYQAVFARLLYYAPQNPKAIDLLAPALAKLMPSHPDNEKVAHLINYRWWADNHARVHRRFEQWLQS
jgi:putative spermidine/putrescine transport system substrate-binding protein